MQTLQVDLTNLKTDAPVLYQRMCAETGLDSKTLLQMIPTYGNLNDAGVSFRSFAALMETANWRTLPKA